MNYISIFILFLSLSNENQQSAVKQLTKIHQKILAGLKKTFYIHIYLSAINKSVFRNWDSFDYYGRVLYWHWDWDQLVERSNVISISCRCIKHGIIRHQNCSHSLWKLFGIVLPSIFVDNFPPPTSMCKSTR